MPVSVVLDHPQAHTVRRLRRSLRTLAGGLLVGVGLLATIVALPAGLVGVFIVGNFFFGTPDDTPGHAPLILLVAAGSITITVVGLKVGLRLLRDNREFVLLLRRFGYGGTTSIATYRRGEDDRQVVAARDAG